MPMDYFYPLAEYLRPWKLFSLACGIALLVVGEYWYSAPDWNIPICLIMAGFTYFTAPCSLRVLMELRWHQLPVALFWTWVSVDGCYALYWYFKDPVALELMRSANARASLVLYAICALIWLFRGTLNELAALTFPHKRS